MFIIAGCNRTSNKRNENLPSPCLLPIKGTKLMIIKPPILVKIKKIGFHVIPRAIFRWLEGNFEFELLVGQKIPKFLQIFLKIGYFLPYKPF